jgi:thioredoxin 1
MKEIKNFEEFNAVQNQTKPVLLDFYADWCGPCRALLPTVEKLADKHADDFIIQKVNVDRFPELAGQFGVRSIPALFVLKNGKIAESLVGYKSEVELENILQGHLEAA